MTTEIILVFLVLLTTVLLFALQLLTVDQIAGRQSNQYPCIAYR